MATATKPSDQPTRTKTGARQPKPLPAPNSDFYQLTETLSADEFAVPLAAADVSIFAISTYDTDYVLIPDAQRSAAIAALEAAGHAISVGM